MKRKEWTIQALGPMKENFCVRKEQGKAEMQNKGKAARGSRAAGQRRVRAETGPDLGLSGAVGVQRSGSLGEAPEQRDNVASEPKRVPISD